MICPRTVFINPDKNLVFVRNNWSAIQLVISIPGYLQCCSCRQASGLSQSATGDDRNGTLNIKVANAAK